MPDSKPLVWVHGEIKTPPFGEAARLEAGYLLRQLQEGETLSLPHSRPMPVVDSRCHELRINDESKTWRIVYAIEADAIVILDVFSKKTRATPKKVLETSLERLKRYRSLMSEEHHNG